MVRNSAQGFEVLRLHGAKMSSDEMAGQPMACESDRHDESSVALACPQCGSADLEQRGWKLVCPECYYTEPCCG